MFRLLTLASLGLGLTLAVAFADDPKIAGKWKLTYTSAGIDFPLAIVEIDTKDGKTTGKLVSARLKGATLESLDVQNGVVTATLNAAGRKWTFEGKPQEDKILGSVALDTTVLLGGMTRTTDTELPANLPAIPMGGALKELAPLRQQVTRLSGDLRKTKDEAKVKEIRKEIAELNTKIDAESYRIYRQIMQKDDVGPTLFDAALFLLRGAGKHKATGKEVEDWAKKVVAQASSRGTRWQQKVAGDVATILASNKEHAGLALEQARLLEKALTDKTPVDRQLEVLGILVKALRTLGRDDEAKPIQTRRDRLDATLDEAYLAKMPPFKGTPFAGRKGDSNRVVVMELFTGAQCPPCVAADVAFDVLEKTYKPTDLVLLQYHLHIPGPDPLTSPASIARWDEYRKAFPDAMRGTPSTVFNGKPAAGGGGGIDRAEIKYAEYSKIINPLLEDKARASLNATATRKGDDITIQVNVADVDRTGGANLKMRVVLVEEKVRYVGSNRLRFHHQVVRAMPGGPAGIELKEKTSKHNLTVNLTELRKDLNKYLDNYAANERPFPHADRPMDLSKLRVVALVQDEGTHEILQATQVHVAE